MAASAIVVIPSRLAASRLPGKPLARIAGEPMIVHVWRRAMEADVGRVVVAVAEREIADAVEAVGGEAILTEPELPSGSDRVHQALQRIDPDRRFGVVVNLQGDLPALDPAAVRRVAELVRTARCDVATLVAETAGDEERDNPDVVKAVVAWGTGVGEGRALYFTRAAAPWGDGPLWHHVGIYGYRRRALERFVALPVSPLERRERLEQLRLLEAGMTIAVARVDRIPAGVDTPGDLERVRALVSGAS